MLVPVLAEAPVLGEALLGAPEEYSDMLSLTERFSGFDIHREVDLRHNTFKITHFLRSIPRSLDSGVVC